jgi:hypothetical protein
VWQQLTTDAADSQDVVHAAQKATSGFFAVAAVLGVSLSPLPNQQLLPVYLESDSQAQAALRRLKDRAKATGADLHWLLLSKDMSCKRGETTLGSHARNEILPGVRALACRACRGFRGNRSR